MHLTKKGIKKLKLYSINKETKNNENADGDINPGSINLVNIAQGPGVESGVSREGCLEMGHH